MNTRNIICAAMALLMSMPAMASNWRVRAVKEKEMKTITIELRDAEAFSLSCEYIEQTARVLALG